MKSTKFNANWKKDPIFQSWLLPDPMSKHSFKCKTCQVTLDLGNMGRGALVKHNKSVKHIKNSEKTKSTSAAMLQFWTRPAAKSVESNLPVSSIPPVTESTSEATVVQADNIPLTSNALDKWAVTDDVLQAEILSPIIR